MIKYIRYSLLPVLVIIPLLLSCSPLTGVFYEVSVYIGGKLTDTAVGQTIEIVLDKITKYFQDNVIIDPDNLNKGTWSGNMDFQSDGASCKQIYTLKKPRMYRESIDSPWQVAPDFRKKVDDHFDPYCS